MVEQTTARHRRRLRNLVLNGRLQLRYIFLVTGISAAIAVSLGLLIFQQSTFASDQIIASLNAADMDWLDETAKSSIRAQLEQSDLDLVATIDGSVVDLNLTPGEQVTPGRPVVTLANFSQWYVETDNLTEIEVVDINLDQEVSIVPDALPEITLSGQVESIKDLFEEKRGDITYTTRILVSEVDPRLRWGMTVVVTFEE